MKNNIYLLIFKLLIKNSFVNFKKIKNNIFDLFFNHILSYNFVPYFQISCTKH